MSDETNTEIPSSVTVTFPKEIEINGTKHTEFELTREPTGADLGRHTFMNLLDGEIKALMHVTPKIIQPYLSPKVIKDMGTANIMALTMGYNAFMDGVDFENLAKPTDTQTTKTTTPSNSSSAQKAD
ncbi:MAG: phage tail assembly protein [Pseudomonadota bacterium]